MPKRRVLVTACIFEASSSPPLLKLWVESMEFCSGVADSESPMDATVVGVSLGFPGRQFASEFFSAADAAVQALARQDTEFDLRDVEPTAVARRVDDRKTPRQAARLGGGKCFV